MKMCHDCQKYKLLKTNGAEAIIQNLPSSLGNHGITLFYRYQIKSNMIPAA